MARWRISTDSTTATQPGQSSALNSPQPPAWAIAATPTASTGKASRRIAVSSTTRARLLLQCSRRGTSCRRRGAAISQTAIAASTPRKTPRRIAGSASRNLSVIGCSGSCRAGAWPRIMDRPRPRASGGAGYRRPRRSRWRAKTGAGQRRETFCFPDYFRFLTLVIFLRRVSADCPRMSRRPACAPPGRRPLRPPQLRRGRSAGWRNRTDSIERKQRPCRTQHLAPPASAASPG